MTLNIVGGTYYEICRDPAWNELYGSGLRAVHTLCEGAAEIVFNTDVGKDDYELLLSITNALKAEVEATIVPFTTLFNYDYPLANPSYSQTEIKDEIPPTIEGELIIQFGMVEGNKKVLAKKVVYDPQSPINPQSFWQNGSETDELIWVANFTEVKTFTGFSDLSKIKTHLFNIEKVNAAIIKMGTNGALLIQKDKDDVFIPLYKTKRVWPIGTGDIYTATFGFNYLINKLPIEECALKASLATAYYTETLALPIPDFIDKSRFKEFYNNSTVKKKIYLAGPFFNMAQRWLVEQFRLQLINFGFEVFSPYHDVGLGDAQKVVPQDINAIERCDLLVAIADGLDSGTMFEIGYAVALKKSIIVFSENEQEESLTMLKGTNCIIESDFSTLIYKTVWEAFKE
ncbi:PfkB family carbohydrate kinase [Mucilaginibacter sp.]|uniref:PfkB family carbohydrate kinase n=1 Tax=Mucilaginibacter sp. TaxID=1882438 RepID=UPI0032656FCC